MVLPQDSAWQLNNDSSYVLSLWALILVAVDNVWTFSTDIILMIRLLGGKRRVSLGENDRCISQVSLLLLVFSFFEKEWWKPTLFNF